MKTKLYMLQEQNKGQMMSYIVQTENGKLIVIDGGDRADGKHLKDMLFQLGGSKPCVDLWLLTHPHTDHIDALLEILEDPGMLHVEKIYDHFVSEEFMAMYEAKAVGDAKSLKRYNEWKRKCPEKFADLQEQQTFELDSVKIKVLSVPDGSITKNPINNSSAVFRMDTNQNRVLFLGDLSEEGGDYVLSYVPHEELKANYVQMAHHGQEGVKKEFYKIVNPSVCLWNTPEWLWQNDFGNGYNTGPFLTLEVRKWMEELGIKKHYITKDGEHVISL